MRTFSFIIVLVLCIASIDCKGKRPKAREGETVTFYDDFNFFNLATWQHEITMSGGGNWEFEYYTNNRSNSYVSNSVLYIQPTLSAATFGEANIENGFTLNLWGGDPAVTCTDNSFYGCERTSGAGGNVLNPIQSASIRTVNSFNFQYGRVEVNAKLPLGDWLWPAIWMLPTYDQYGAWPASGEIDIVESRGNDASYAAGGVNQFGSTLHWGPFWPEDPYMLTHETYTLPSGDFSQEFHTFGLVWTNETIYTYLDTDTNVVLKVPITQSFWDLGGFENMPGINNPWQDRPNDAPFDQQMFLIFNLACGGTNGYFPDGVGGKPWTDSSPSAVNEFYQGEGQWLPTWNSPNNAMQIDWVQVSSFN